MSTDVCSAISQEFNEVMVSNHSSDTQLEQGLLAIFNHSVPYGV